MRFIILAALVILIIVVLRHLFGGGSRPETPRVSRHGTMVRCEHCGLHVPASEAVRSENKFFCSNSHLEDYRQVRSE
jgi:uncharacterized protein